MPRMADDGFEPQFMTRSERFLTSPSEQVDSPTSCSAMIEGAWQSEAVVSIVAPIWSARRQAARWPSVLLRDKP